MKKCFRRNWKPVPKQRTYTPVEKTGEKYEPDTRRIYLLLSVREIYIIYIYIINTNINFVT